MTYSFDINLGTTRDRIRARLGDTDENHVLLDDQTYDALLTLRSDDFISAAIDSCRAIQGKMHRDIDRSNVGVTANRSQRFNQIETVLRDLIRESNVQGGIFVGGLSIAGKEALESDADFVQPTFKVGDMDNPDRRSRDNRNRFGW